MSAPSGDIETLAEKIRLESTKLGMNARMPDETHNSVGKVVWQSQRLTKAKQKAAVKNQFSQIADRVFFYPLLNLAWHKSSIQFKFAANGSLQEPIVLKKYLMTLGIILGCSGGFIIF